MREKGGFRWKKWEGGEERDGRREREVRRWKAEGGGGGGGEEILG